MAFDKIKVANPIVEMDGQILLSSPLPLEDHHFQHFTHISFWFFFLVDFCFSWFFFVRTCFRIVDLFDKGVSVYNTLLLVVSEYLICRKGTQNLLQFRLRSLDYLDLYMYMLTSMIVEKSEPFWVDDSMIE